VGPSGCGKSTLLRLIAGLEEITAATSSSTGPSNDVPPPKRGLAMVFQSYALYPHMSVADNMGFSLSWATLAKRSGTEGERRRTRPSTRAAASTASPGALGGQRQRPAMGRAIVRNPKSSCFDEPLSNLDAALTRADADRATPTARRLSATMIYVTHDQVEAMTMANRSWSWSGRCRDIESVASWPRPAIVRASFPTLPARTEDHPAPVSGAGHLRDETPSVGGISSGRAVALTSDVRPA